MSQLFSGYFFTAQDADGDPMSGAKLWFSLTGTTTLATVYADEDLSTPLTNPVEADSAGRFPAVWLDPDVIYRVRLSDADDNFITKGDVDPITSKIAADELTDDETELSAITAKLLFLQSGSGAEYLSLQAVLRAFAVTPEQFGAVADGTTDDAVAIRAAIATGKNVYFPGASYAVGSTIYQQTEGQKIFGRGTYGTGGTTLIWTGSSGRMFEMRSTRASGGGASDTRTGMQFTDFKIETATGSIVTDLIWIEDGVFHSNIERVYIRNLLANPSGACIKFDSGGGLSYPVRITLRDVTVRGGGHASDPTPLGIWLESAIEARFFNVFTYDCTECWRIGTNTPADYRTVSDCAWFGSMAEVGDRGNLDGTARCMQFYSGADLRFYGFKFVAGVSFASATDQHCIAIDMATGGAFRSITFDCPEFSGNNRANNAIIVDSSVTDSAGFRFIRPDVVNFNTRFITSDSAASPDIEVIDPIVSGYNLGKGTFKGRGFTYDPGSLGDGAGETTAFDNVTVQDSEPILVSHTRSLQGMLLTAYKNTSSAQVVSRLQNETGGTLDLTSGTIRFRTIHPDEIKASVSMAYDPASLADGAGLTATIPVPGAAMGDLVAVGFYTAASGNMNGVQLFGYVSAAGTVSARFQNETGSTVNLSAGVLTAYVLKGFDRVGTATYDPASLADGAGVTTTLTVTGAELGDFVVVSFSNDLQGIIMTGYVSATDGVSVRFQNETAGVLDLASGTITAAVYKRATVI